MAVADREHGRRARGWPTTGRTPEDATTVHVSTTGTPRVSDPDTTERDIREAKWNARDNLGRT